MAPRVQLATKSARGVKSFFRSQQNTGHSAAAKKRIFINCENTFGGFSFQRPIVQDEFQPVVSIARVKCPISAFNPANEFFMRLDFASNLDGQLNKAQVARPPLDVIFSVDVSGSMGSCFPNDVDRRCKLDVAKEAILKIIAQLTAIDRAGLVIFNTEGYTHMPLTLMTPKNSSKFAGILKKIQISGGTDLARGLQHGYDEMRQAKAVIPGDVHRLQRIFFLTDMESSDTDEKLVLEIARSQTVFRSICTQTMAPTNPVVSSSQSPSDNLHKRKLTNSPVRSIKKAKPEFNTPVHLSLVGIGVDLSITTVEAISSIPGAKYTSIVNAADFVGQVAEDFNYDVRPIAFDIQLDLPRGVSFSKVFGSAELNSLPPESQRAVISAEFPVPLDALNCTQGGIYLARLKVNAAEVKEGLQTLTYGWTDIHGTKFSKTLNFQIPCELPAGALVSPGADHGLRKAVALSEYVQCLTDYVASDDIPEPTSDLGAPGHAMADSDDDDENGNTVATGQVLFVCAPETLQALRALNLTDNLVEEGWPVGTPVEIRKHWQHVVSFQKLKPYVLQEMEAVADASLTCTNQNVLQTMDQIIRLETDEIGNLIGRLKTADVAVSTESTTQLKPHSYLCPITLAIMKDPVMLSDGHSYERSAILKWLKDHKTSPVTNLPLAHTRVTDNHTLRGAIAEFSKKTVEVETKTSAEPQGLMGTIANSCLIS